MGRAFSWVGSKVKENFPGSPVHGAPYSTLHSETGGGLSPSAAAPPGFEAMYTEPPAGYAMPVSTHAARASGDVATGLAVTAGSVWGTSAGAPEAEATPPPMPQFT